MQKYVKKSEILPVPCQYVFSFMTVIVNNQENIQAYSSVQFFFGLPRALFCFGIHFYAILGNLPSAIL